MSHDIDSLDWQKVNGLIPAIIQDAKTQKVLMLGYMNRESCEKSIAEKRVTFYSRSKQRFWTKGETSGNFLNIEEMLFDCDNDTILILVNPVGPCCHKGPESCFGDEYHARFEDLAKLETLIAERAEELPDDSYTTTLFKLGIKRIAQKVGEEGVEVALAAVAESDDEFVGESADLLYHLLVLLQAKDISLERILQKLAARA